MNALQHKPRFFWLALAAGILASGVWIFEAANVFLVGRYQKVIGWSPVLQKGTWQVGSVTSGGPAHGKLRPGDRLVSIDGDSNVNRIGPLWRLTDSPVDRSYRVEVLRDERPVSVVLNFEVKPDPDGLAWGLLFLLVAGSFLASGLMLGLLKPEDPVARDGFVVSLLVGLFMVCVASNMLNGMHGPKSLAVSLTLYSVVPLHVLWSYFFFAGFPEHRPEIGGWLVLRRALTVLAVAIWVPVTLVNLIRMLGPDAASSILGHYWNAFSLYRLIIAPAQMLFLAAAAAATLAVGLRNYRRLGEGDLRRRLRWMAWGAVAGTVPSIGASLVWAVLRAAGDDNEWASTISAFTRVTNALAVITPITMSYAILKHRVLGIQVVIRLGVQYLLASQSLRLILFLPLAGLVAVVLRNPDKPLGELLTGGPGRINLVLLALTALSLRYRVPLRAAIDRRFFRGAYDREQILVRLIDRIKDLDSVEGFSRTLSQEIETAMHTRWVSVLYHADHKPEYSLVYTTAAREGEIDLQESAALVQLLGKHQGAQMWQSLRESCPAAEIRWLDAMGVQILIPIIGTDHRVLGIVLLGDKKSEEPYTRKDKELLESIAAQIGVLCENLSLRERMHRERKIQQAVMATSGSRELQLMKECLACGTCFDSAATKCHRDGAELELTLPVERVIDGKYRLDRRLGQGGMGAVYEAHDLRLERQVAVKIMTGSLFGDARAMRRFSREAKASARLEHPNIVRVHDFGELAINGGFLVMEYVEGATWRAHIRRLGAFPREMAADLLDQLFDGVEAAHRAKIIHRDLKPDNVLISNGKAKILDFGLAKMKEMEMADPKSLTVAGVALGTPGYMSPEQLRGDEVDERTDVFSLGVIALETLTGELGLRGRAFHQALYSALGDRFAFAGVTAGQLEIQAILATCLSEDSESRLGSVAELRRALIPLIRSADPFPYASPAVASGPVDTQTIAE
ncbi:MAG: protein kinase [Bryobacteraceae bacterium]